MTKSQKVTLNFLLFLVVVIAIYFMRLLDLFSISLFIMGVLWPYIYHLKHGEGDKKKNRFSFFWFLEKFFKGIEQISNKYLRELVLVLCPYLVLQLFSKVLKSDVDLNPFLIGIIGFELIYLTVRLVRPDKLNK